MDSQHVSGFDATQYVHPTVRNDSRARLSVLQHFEALRSNWLAQEGALVGVVGPGGDLEAVRMLAPREAGGAMWCVGRHAFADIRLQSSVEAPLRAMAIHVARGPGGHMRVIDLQTPTGFFVRGIGQCRDVTVSGPALLEVAGYLLVLVPLGSETGRSAVAFWDNLAHPRVVDVVAIGAPADEDEEVVTVMRAIPLEPSSVTAVRVVFELTFDTSSMLTAVSPAELRRGVLCGRYNRCALGGRALRNMLRVSRVHLLLVLAGESLFGFDLATTCGTTLNGVTRRYFALRSGDVIHLSD